MQLVPVLNNPAPFVDAEDFDSSQVTIAGPMLKAVKHYKIAIRDDAFELRTFPRILGSHSRELLDEGLLAIGRARIVLNIDVTDILLYGFGRFALIEHQVVEGYDIPFVLF